MQNLKRAAIMFASIIAVAGMANTAEAQVATSDATGYMGAWNLAIDAQGQAFDMDLDVTDNSGNVAAKVGAMGMSTEVSRISKAGDNLVLSYTMDAQGQQVPVIITLSPTADGLNAELDFAGGMFVAGGKGTKK